MNVILPSPRRLVLLVCLTVTLLTGCVTCPPSQTGQHWVRTELYFGMNRLDGGSVTDSQWQTFVNEVVTERFPQGFTVLPGEGQYLDRAHQLTVEHSRVLVLVHPADPIISRNIDEICAAYCRQFDQESVMKVESPVCISFESAK